MHPPRWNKMGKMDVKAEVKQRKMLDARVVYQIVRVNIDM